LIVGTGEVVDGASDGEWQRDVETWVAWPRAPSTPWAVFLPEVGDVRAGGLKYPPARHGDEGLALGGRGWIQTANFPNYRSGNYGASIRCQIPGRNPVLLHARRAGRKDFAEVLKVLARSGTFAKLDPPYPAAENFATAYRN
jgi:hypothetical protein